MCDILDKAERNGEYKALYNTAVQFFRMGFDMEKSQELFSGLTKDELENAMKDSKTHS